MIIELILKNNLGFIFGLVGRNWVKQMSVKVNCNILHKSQQFHQNTFFRQTQELTDCMTCFSDNDLYCLPAQQMAELGNFGHFSFFNNKKLFFAFFIKLI